MSTDAHLSVFFKAPTSPCQTKNWQQIQTKNRIFVFKDAKCYTGSTIYNAGMTLINLALVSVWRIYDPEKNTFEKA